MRFISLCIFEMFCLLSVGAIKDPNEKRVQNFVFFGRDREFIHHENFLSTKKLVGAQLMYAWKELEKEEGQYDFSEIRNDLTYLSSKGKKLFIQLQDTTFNPKATAVPKYLTEKPKYNGGVVHQKNEKGEQEGWVLRRWDPMVRERLRLLLVALAQEFEGKIEGITLQETAVGVYENEETKKQGFTFEKYRDGILDNMRSLSAAFVKSVRMQYVNFMPGEWLPFENKGYMDSAFKTALRLGVAIGAPDLLPKKKSQLNHAYRYMNQLGDEMIVGIAVQDGNYSGTTNELIKPTPPWPNLVPQLDEFAREHLKVNYIFWGAEEPYFSHDVVPYFK